MDVVNALVEFLNDVVRFVCTSDQRAAFLVSPAVDGIRIDSWAPEGRTISVCVTEGDATVGVVITADGRLA